jgi:hypothetical protein
MVLDFWIFGVYESLERLAKSTFYGAKAALWTVGAKLKNARTWSRDLSGEETLKSPTLAPFSLSPRRNTWQAQPSRPDERNE